MLLQSTYPVPFIAPPNKPNQASQINNKFSLPTYDISNMPFPFKGLFYIPSGFSIDASFF